MPFKKIHFSWAWAAFALGCLLNAGVQASLFKENGDLFRRYDQTFGEFLRQFSWLMMGVSGGFFALIGSLVQRRMDERDDKLEIEAELRKRKGRKA